MLRRDRNDDAREFVSPCLVDGHGISRHQFVKIVKGVADDAAVEVDVEFASLQIEVRDVSDLANADPTNHVVGDLHHLVFFLITMSEAPELTPMTGEVVPQRGHGRKQPVHCRDVEHGGVAHDEQIALNRVLPAPFEHTFRNVVFEQLPNAFHLALRQFGETASAAFRRCAEPNVRAFIF